MAKADIDSKSRPVSASNRLHRQINVYDADGKLQKRGLLHPHPELPFGTISALSVWKDRLFVVDVLNRRIVKCRIVYGQSEKKGP